MRITFTKNFIKDSKKLPNETIQKLVYFLEILSKNPYDSKLHSKRLKPPLAGILSFRIGIKYRVLFVFESSKEIKLLNIKDRKDIYKTK